MDVKTSYTPSPMSAPEERPGATRIDRWLFGVRLFNSRSVAEPLAAYPSTLER